MKTLIFSLSLILSLSSFAQETISTIKNRKTGELLKLNCLDQFCEVIEIIHEKSSKESEMMARLTQAELMKNLSVLSKKMKVKFKDHFFICAQGISELPWDNDEFILFYVLMSPVTVPLTIVAAGIDIALTPVGVVSITVDMFDGNVGKKVQRKIEKKKSFKLSNANFKRLVTSLQAL